MKHTCKCHDTADERHTAPAWPTNSSPENRTVLSYKFWVLNSRICNFSGDAFLMFLQKVATRWSFWNMCWAALLVSLSICGKWFCETWQRCFVIRNNYLLTKLLSTSRAHSQHCRCTLSRVSTRHWVDIPNSRRKHHILPRICENLPNFTENLRTDFQNFTEISQAALRCSINVK